MHVFSGKNPRVYVLGEQFDATQVPLIDCGGGWDWCSPDGLHCWEQEPEFEVWQGEWESIQPLDVFPRAGVVSFNRCLEGLHVRASGSCCPTSLLLESDQWRLQVESAVYRADTLGSDTVQTKAKTLRSTAFIEGVVCDSQEKAFVLFPFNSGAFAGVGSVENGFDGVIINFNDEGVVYEPARPKRY